MSMVAVILGGSHVWKDTSFEALGPRLLLPVANAALVSYTLGWLRAGGVTRVVLCANEGVALLEAALSGGQTHGCELVYYVDRMPRGPAGCCRDVVAVSPAEVYVVVEGASIPRLDLRALLRAHAGSGAAATIAVESAPDADAAAEPRPAGVYVFQRAALEAIPPAGFQDIKEMLIPRLHQTGAALLTWPASSSAPRLHDLSSYFALQAWMLGELRAGSVEQAGYSWRDGTYAHESARMAGSARLLGPVMVGPRSRIESGAVVLGPTVIGADCALGAESVVGESILWDRCTVADRARVTRALLTTGARANGASAHAAFGLEVVRAAGAA